MAVYFAQAKHSKAVKIGKAKYPEERLKFLQTGCSEPLSIVYIHPGGYSEESKFHKMFAKSRLHGEWFVYEPEISAYMREIYNQQESRFLEEKQANGIEYQDWVKKERGLMEQHGRH